MTQSLYSLSCLGDSHLKTHVIVRKISFAPNPGDSAVSYVPPQQHDVVKHDCSELAIC